MAGYALKYRDGVYTAPNQRGFAAAPVVSISDRTGWLWWGLPGGRELAQANGFLYAMHPATSSWRPNRVLCNIARKNLPNLPLEQRNTKTGLGYADGNGRYTQFAALGATVISLSQVPTNDTEAAYSFR